jgi:hypothetical protein
MTKKNPTPTPAVEALPTPELLRRKMGLARTQMLRALRTADMRVLDTPDDQQDPIVLSRCALIEREYGAYVAETMHEIWLEAEHPDYADSDATPYLSSRQAARALGVGEFHLANMRDRGKLKAHHRVGRNYAFAVADLLTLVQDPASAGGYNSPLASAFLAYLEQATSVAS